MKRPTKIISTLGPSTSSLSKIIELVQNGMNVARLNFSHGSTEEKIALIDSVRAAERDTGIPIGILQDLPGPKIRVGDLPVESIALNPGDEIALVLDDDSQTSRRAGCIPVQFDNLLADIPGGATVLLDDGKIELSVEEKSAGALTCRIIRGGDLLSHKGVTFPDQELTLATPTDDDLVALDFGLEHDIDFVAVSFVQTASNIDRVRAYIRDRGKRAAVVAKIERKIALNNIEEIVGASDAIMVARGDLGIESDITMLPIHQRRIVKCAISAGKAVIIATQMLESMMESEIPSRAEASDIAQAVYSGADAMMLSGETAVGDHPGAAVATMSAIAENVFSKNGIDSAAKNETEHADYDTIDDAVAKSVVVAASNLKAAAIVAYTLSGKTAQLIARYRPNQRVIAVTPYEKTQRALALRWGVAAVRVPEIESSFMQAIRNGDRALIDLGMVKPGDVTVVTGGIPEGKSGGTNVMKIHLVGG